MRCRWLLAAIGLLPMIAPAQTSLPPGTLIPVSLSGSLNVQKLSPGQKIRADVMQDLPGTSIKRRARLIGQARSLHPSSDGHPRLEIRFDAVEIHGQQIPVKTCLRAMASFNEVQEAQIPEEGASRGITPEVATTRQIGGDQVYRGGGPVAVGVDKVGEPTPWGVLAIPRAQPGTPCRGIVDGNTTPQAFWLFSTDACGVYGFSHIRIEHSGRTQPTGTIVLATDEGKLNLRSGTAFLLRVLE